MEIIWFIVQSAFRARVKNTECESLLSVRTEEILRIKTVKWIESEKNREDKKKEKDGDNRIYCPDYNPNYW